MTDTIEIVHDAIRGDAIYTPAEVAAFAKCSAGFVRTEIRKHRLPAFRLGGKLLRVKGCDAWEWMTKQLVSTDSENSDEHQGSSLGGNGAPSGAARKTVADTALVSVLNKRRA